MPSPKVSKEKTPNAKMIDDANNIIDVSYGLIVSNIFIL